MVIGTGLITNEDFLTYLRFEEIPPAAPEGSSPYGRNFMSGDFMAGFEARREATETHWMWAIVDQVWTKMLAEWIGDRTVLEIMAGRGWLAKALLKYNVAILPTDNYEWRKHPSQPIHETVTGVDVLEINAKEAVECSDEDILLCSWPPYDDNTFTQVCRLWGEERPIVYIGEGEGGCNADDEFFRHFIEEDNVPGIPLMAWNGIHDYVAIGNWSNDEKPPEEY